MLFRSRQTGLTRDDLVVCHDTAKRPLGHSATRPLGLSAIQPAGMARRHHRFTVDRKTRQIRTVIDAVNNFLKATALALVLGTLDVGTAGQFEGLTMDEQGRL